MIGYAEREIFGQRDLQVLEKATEMVQLAPYELQGDLVRCHELARAVGMLLHLQVVDGWYGMVEHSWLWMTPHAPLEPLPNVLDVYAPGRLPAVMLVHTSSYLPFEYRRGDERIDVRHHVVSELVEMMRGAL